MEHVNLRDSLNAISDVVINRPPPLREFDQIYMKAADMILHSEHLSRHFSDRRVAFIGDGDAISLCLIHLHNLGLLQHGPKSVCVLDFDERVVGSIQRFAEQFGIADRVSSELYNVADPLPTAHWQAFDAFQINPPFGSSNGGKSVEAFFRRATEAVRERAVGCLVLADHPEHLWTQENLVVAQGLVLETGFAIVELIPQFHHYHLDDAPELTSCSMVVQKTGASSGAYDSRRLGSEFIENFYGRDNPLRVRYVRDLRGGGKLPSRDHKVEPFPESDGGKDD